MKNSITTQTTDSIFKLRTKLTAGFIATAAVFALAISPALADVENTATVSGSTPSGGSVTGTSNTVAVDPIDSTSTLSVSKTGTLLPAGDVNSDGNVDAGDTITYDYTIENTGTTSLVNVGVVDTHDGDGTFATPAFFNWTTQAGSPSGVIGSTTATLYPDAIAIFRTTYVVTATDITNAGGTGVGLTVDNDLDNSAVANGTYDSNGIGTAGGETAVASAAATAEVPLDIVATMTVAKAAYEGGLPAILGGTGVLAGADRPAGTVITYVYTITNTGNVPATNVGLTDAHNGLGTFTAPAYNSLTNTSGLSDNSDGTPNTIEVLGPTDVVYYTTDYTITQDDVDQRQ